MVWLILALGSYVLLAVTALIDKIPIGGPTSNPKIYAFYVGILSAAAFLFCRSVCGPVPRRRFF